MLKATLLVLTTLFFFKEVCFAYVALEREDFSLSLSTYVRQDLVTFKNVTDLDSGNCDDTGTYIGIDYNLALNLQFKEGGPELYLKLERNGPYDYDAPLFIHNTLMTSGGTIERYRKDELLPQLEEFWLDIPMGSPFRFKFGLYTYEVGNGFSLNGSFENYGFTLYQEREDFIWRIYYCRPELVYKNQLGPHIRQDEEQGVFYESNASNFFATDIKVEGENFSYQPYVGVLADYTSSGKRDSTFTSPIKRDILGTAGLAVKMKKKKVSLEGEIAHNFGKAKSSNCAYKDIYHTGYLLYTGIDYSLKRFTPSLQFLICSGNKVTEEMAGDETLTSGKNRAFSSYSPLNINLGDSISSVHSDMRPIVAMGSGFGLNYGIARPGAFVTSDFHNIVIASLGLDFNATEKLFLGIYGYYLRSHEKPVGRLNGEPRYLSQDLGSEIDVFFDYKFNQNILFSILGGYFFPGSYYNEERHDTGGSLFSPYLRGDSDADCAYQIEAAVEFQF